jgi:23S rRNA pseudouridine1911/1915/1917 synthase
MGLNVRSVTLPHDIAPVRLDVCLARQLPNGSRRSAQRVIAAGEVRINGRRARKGQMVAGGDVLQVPEALYAPATLRPNPHLLVRILYEDDTLIAVDKPAGMPAHALRPDETETVANFLLAHDPTLAGVGRSHTEPGIVHRLDTDTSGVLLAARTADAYQALRRQFGEQTVTKNYLALVDGDVAVAGVLRAPLAHNQRDRRRMRVCSGAERAAGLRLAVTAYRPIERFSSYTLLAVRMRTGVRHQIRVHLASIGHPIVGDRLYGCASLQGVLPGHCLHACRLGFTHPATGKPMRVTSPLPGGWIGVLEALREKQRASRTQWCEAGRNGSPDG